MLIFRYVYLLTFIIKEIEVINMYIFFTLIGSLIGIIILVYSLIVLIKIFNIIKSVTDEEYYTKYNVIIKKYLILCIIGISITSSMQLLRIFLR